jgi:hypothetical protein
VVGRTDTLARRGGYPEEEIGESATARLSLARRQTGCRHKIDPINRSPDLVAEETNPFDLSDMVPKTVSLLYKYPFAG